MIKTMKVKLRPNNKQNTLLFKCADLSRFSYNWALSRQEENHANGGKFINDCCLRKMLTELKKSDFSWMYEFSNNITKQSIKDACNAYKRWFNGISSQPVFKQKDKSKPSFYHDSQKLKVTEKHVKLEKIGLIKLTEFGRIPVNVKYYNPRITYDGISWWISVGIDVDQRCIDKEKSAPIGIDLGIKDFVIVSNGIKFKNINKSIEVLKAKKTILRLKNKVRKSKGINGDSITNNSAKTCMKIRKLYKRVVGLRTNYTHKITTKLVNTNPEYIVVEDLSVENMKKSKYLRKFISEQQFYEFRRQLDYKCSLNMVELILADRFFPSSKKCSCCGKVKDNLTLADRTYRCECGNVIDRDLQAAINLRDYPRK